MGASYQAPELGLGCSLNKSCLSYGWKDCWCQSSGRAGVMVAEENWVSGKGKSMCLPEAIAMHNVIALKACNTPRGNFLFCRGGQRGLRRLCNLPGVPQLHPEHVEFSWGLNLSHPSLQKTGPIYFWKMFRKFQGS